MKPDKPEKINPLQIPPNTEKQKKCTFDEKKITKSFGESKNSRIFAV